MEIPIPDSFRGRVMDLAVEYDEQTGEKLKKLTSPKPLEILSKVDSLQKTAERRLFDFLDIYQKNDQETRGWAQVRKYTAPGTAFLYGQDPIALDSVVVAQEYITYPNHPKEEPLETKYYWIAPKKDPKYQLPFLYRATSQHDPNGGLKWSVAPERQHIADEQGWQDMANLFSCTPEPSESGMKPRYEYEIWKQGKTLTAPKPQKEAQRSPGHTVLTPQPQPIPV